MTILLTSLCNQGLVEVFYLTIWQNLDRKEKVCTFVMNLNLFLELFRRTEEEYDNKHKKELENK